jgi:hypothetical protein
VKELAPDVLEPETGEEFETWIDKWPEGFVINRISENKIRIHYGKCGHFKGMVGMNPLAHRKILSRNSRALRAWWAEQSEQPPAPCPSCKADA